MTRLYAFADRRQLDEYDLTQLFLGVLRDPDDSASGIDRLTPDEALAFAAGAACRSGMKPKVTAAAGAVKSGAAAAYICAVKSNAIASALLGDATIVCAA